MRNATAPETDTLDREALADLVEAIAAKADKAAPVAKPAPKAKPAK